MPKDWIAREEESFVESLFSLQKEIHALADRGRSVNVRLNVRELLAPLVFSKELSLSERALASMMVDVEAVRGHLSILSEKLSLLFAEIFPEGGAVRCS